MVYERTAQYGFPRVLRTIALPWFLSILSFGSVSAETVLPVPDGAIEVNCRQEFKDMRTRFYQYILISIDQDLGETLHINLSDPTSSWSASALVYLQTETDVKRLINKVDFFQDGNGGYISGQEGYRYGSFGVGSNNGVFIKYDTQDELGNSIFDKILGCYLLR